MAIRNLQQFNRDADFEYEPDLIGNNLTQNASPIIPQKTVQPVNQQTMAAPAALVNPAVNNVYKYSGNSLEDYLSSQQSAFKPQLLQAGTYSLNEGGENITPDVYSTFDPNKATQDYMGQRDTARTGLTPELSRTLSGMGQYQEYTDKLAKEIGYAGPKTIKAENPFLSGGTDEGGNSYSAPQVDELHPDFLDALSGYKIENAVIGSNDPAVNIYKPDGSLMGKYRVGNNSENSFDRVMEVALPLILSGMAGGALAGPLLGALSVTAPGAIATGIASGGISGGLNAGIQGGDVLKGILMGGVGGGIGGAASPFASSVAKDIVGAGGPAFLADAAKGAITGAARAAPGAIASGDFNNVLTGALSGGVGSGVSSVVGSILPDKMTENANVDSAIVKGIGGLAGGLAKAGITGGNVDVINSLLPAVAQGISDEYKLPLKQVEAGLGVASKVLQGKDLVPSDILSIGTAFGINAKGNQAASKPDAGQGSSFEEEGGESGTDETPSIDEELGFSNYTAPTQAPAPQDDIFDILNGVVDSGGYDIQEQTETTPSDLTQQVVVTPPAPSIDQELGFSNYVAPIDQELGFSEYDLPVDLKMSGERSNIALGQEPQQVTVTGKNSEDYLYNPTAREVTAIQPSTEVDAGKYLDSLPQDVASTLPEILAQAPAPAPAPAPASSPASAPASAPATEQDSGFDLSSLMLLLGMGGKESAPPPIELVKGLNFDPNSFYQDSSSGSMDDLVRLLQSRG
jgi:hypothetical protein